MPPKTLQDVMKSHQEFLQKMAEQIDTVKQGLPLPADLADREQENLLAQTTARLDTLRQAKEAAVKRFDEEIRAQEEMINRLKAGAAGGNVLQPTASQREVKPTPEPGRQQAPPSAKAEASGKPAGKKARKARKARPA
jgi:hypothetical protein